MDVLLQFLTSDEFKLNAIDAEDPEVLGSLCSSNLFSSFLFFLSFFPRFFCYFALLFTSSVEYLYAGERLPGVAQSGRHERTPEGVAAGERRAAARRDRSLLLVPLPLRRCTTAQRYLVCFVFYVFESSYSYRSSLVKKYCT